MKDLNPYEVLNIPRTATRDEIHKAYRALARRWHPDRFAEGPEWDWANEKMAEINAAYSLCMRSKEDARRADEQSELNQLRRIEALIDRGECAKARQLLMTLTTRCAQWNYLLGALLLKTGEANKARIYLSVAAHQQPDCRRYAEALKNANRTGMEGFRILKRFAR